MGRLRLLVVLALTVGYTAGPLRAAVGMSLSPVGVANRDAEGAVVVDADRTKNFLPTAASCRDACLRNPDCNVWVWCGAVSGCATGGNSNRDPSRWQQCWLKYDTPPAAGTANTGRWPRAKNLPDQQTGWLSGMTPPGVIDGAPTPEKTYSCKCRSSYTYGGYKFQGVCAVLRDNYGPECPVEEGCRNKPSDGMQGCPSNQPCTVLLDTDLQEEKVIVSGDSNTADSSEDCCWQCANTKGCNAWTWCSDARGCGGEIFRFRQCWLKTANPLAPQAKKGFGGSPGWISGVRLAWLPQ